MKTSDINTLHHASFKLTFHLVLVVKYRRKVIDADVLKTLEKVLRATLDKWECSLIEFNGERDHVHLLIEAHPKVLLSTLVNNLKTVSSRLVRKEHPHLKSKFSKPVFWSRTYCLLSCGGAPLEVIKQYIQNQSND